MFGWNNPCTTGSRNSIALINFCDIANLLRLQVGISELEKSNGRLAVRFYLTVDRFRCFR